MRLSFHNSKTTATTYFGTNDKLVTDNLLNRLNEWKGHKQTDVTWITVWDGSRNASGQIDRFSLGLWIEFPVARNQGLAGKQFCRRSRQELLVRHKCVGCGERREEEAGGEFHVDFGNDAESRVLVVV
jgi:hypothetical protein